MKEDLLKIINNYGVSNQLKKMSEEVFELQEAIIYAEYNRVLGISNEPCVEAVKHIAEEISDCYVILEQFRHHYGISDEEIKKVMKYKINRQLERMEKNEK